MSKPTRTITIDDREIQFEEPNWHPLLEFIGEPLIDDFMWMHAVKMPNGREAQAYKHSLTQRYIHLDSDLNTYGYAGGRYVPQRQDDALLAAYAFGLLHGHLEPDEILALQIAYGRANELASRA